MLNLDEKVINLVRDINDVSSLILSNKEEVSVRDLENLSSTFGEYKNLFNNLLKEKKVKEDEEKFNMLGKKIDTNVYNITISIMSNGNKVDLKDLVELDSLCLNTINDIDKYSVLCKERGINNKYVGIRLFLLRYRKTLSTLFNLNKGKDVYEEDMLDMISFVVKNFYN